MEAQSNDRLAAGIPLGDLKVASGAIMLRLADAAQETSRINQMRDFLGCASELNLALSVYVRHALVDCCGTHGTADLAVDTQALHRALDRYSTFVAVVAAEYGDIVLANQNLTHVRPVRSRSRDVAVAVS